MHKSLSKWFYGFKNKFIEILFKSVYVQIWFIFREDLKNRDLIDIGILF